MATYGGNSKRMTVINTTTRQIDLSTTLQSGQTFRWKLENDWFHNVIFNNLIKIRQKSDHIEFYSYPDQETKILPLLTDYLGLNNDLDKIYASISTDSNIKSAIKEYRGMQILRQDPWECLVSFICSSASNIPRISRNIENICNNFGTSLKFGSIERNSFPSPEALAKAGENKLRMLGLGYRASYLANTARIISTGSLNLMDLRKSSYQDALNSLVLLDGVGDKVANCIMLFSLDKPNAFPVDVWIQRALQEWYLGDQDKKISPKNMRIWAHSYFGDYAGYANQYLFQHRRLLKKTGS